MDSRFSASFIANLKNWMKLDSELKRQNKIAADIRTKKNELEKILLKHVSSNGLENTQINVGDMKLIPSKTYQMPPLNEALLKEVLFTILKNESNVSAIMDKISQKRNRERREVFALKMKKKGRLSSKRK
jgi:hypothetical protein